MDEKLYKRTRKRVISILNSFGYAHEGEDIAHEVMISILKNSDRKSTIRQRVIDYLRTNGSFHRKGKTNKFCLFGKSHTEVDEDLVEVEETLHSKLSNIEGYLHLLSKRERIIAVLTYVFDFKDSEVAYCFNVAPETIGVYRREFLKKLKPLIESL